MRHAGLCSLFGMWATLIIMEVIPFLALAVGVDNMFILAHALHRQPPTNAAGCDAIDLYIFCCRVRTLCPLCQPRSMLQSFRL